MKTHLDLFSGIGGFALAARWTGFTTVQFVEIEPFPQAVLRKNFAGVPIHADIQDFDARPLRGTILLITGGFPCQDISAAGKGAGLIEGKRSSLWFEYLRIIRECEPAFCLIENVPRLRTLGADRVLQDLAEAGYTAEAFVVGADDIGATHRRKRVWIVAYTGYGTRRPICTDCERRDTSGEWAGGDGQVAGSGKEMAHANATGRGEHCGGIPGGDFLSSWDAIVRQWPTPRANKPEGYSSQQFRPALAETATQQWPTHRTADGMTHNLRSPENIQGNGRGRLEDVVALTFHPDPQETGAVSPQSSGRLNPAFVQWMMGYPEDWFDGVEMPVKERRSSKG